MEIRNGYWIGGAVTLARSIGRGDVPRAVAGEKGPVEVVPVATDGGGNMFLVATTGEVWRYNHENGRLTLVADTFDAFLDLVADDWCTTSRDERWSYLV